MTLLRFGGAVQGVRGLAPRPFLVPRSEAVHKRMPLKALRGCLVRVHARVMEALAGHPVTRRSVLAGAASVAAGWGSLGATASRAAGGVATASPGAADWRAFARDLSGALLRPG